MSLQKPELVFTILNEEKIRYCHWKSNANLSESFQSKTDFDLLIDDRDADKFYHCMNSLGLKRRYSSPDKVYPGIEDYLGFDEVSGKIFHLHVHFKLIIGKKYQKNYHMPFEDLVLSTSVYDEHYPIRIIQFELELLLLIIRSILKVDWGMRMFAKNIIGKSLFPLNIHKEFAFLRGKSNQEIFYEYAGQLFPEMLDVFKKMYHGEIGTLSYRQVLKFHKKIIRTLKPFQLFSKRALKSELKIKRLASRNARNWLSSGGVSVAFVGVDGSGKSSTVSHIGKWLGWKLSVKTAYMGLPKNDNLIEMLDVFTNITNKLKLPFLKEHITLFKWVLVARLRHKIYRNSEMLKNQGRIVIFDRFPLKEFWDMNEPMDGPRIQNSCRWAKTERTFYHNLKYPDYIFILQVNEEESINRKKEHLNAKKRHLIKEKIKAVDKLVKTKSDRLIIMDTLKGQEQTLLEIKRKLWELL
jgi:thymidylate kinase